MEHPFLDSCTYCEVGNKALRNVYSSRENRSEIRSLESMAGTSK